MLQPNYNFVCIVLIEPTLLSKAHRLTILHAHSLYTLFKSVIMPTHGVCLCSIGPSLLCVFPQKDTTACVYFAVHFGAATIYSKAALITLGSMNAITQAPPSFPLNCGGPSNRYHHEVFPSMWDFCSC